MIEPQPRPASLSGIVISEHCGEGRRPACILPLAACPLLGITAQRRNGSRPGSTAQRLNGAPAHRRTGAPAYQRSG